MPQRITFIGSGQISAVLVAMIALKNRELDPKDKIEISILGNQNSKSLLAMQQKGITISATKEGRPLEIVINPSELTITDKVSDIVGSDGSKKQNHIVVATKAYSHDQALLSAIKQLRIDSISENSTNVVLAQNGVPIWLMPSLQRSQIGAVFSSDDGRFFESIGRDNIVGCALNLACNITVDDNLNPIYGVYNLSTPLERVGVPLGRIVPQSASENLINLLKIFNDAEIDTRSDGGKITKEVLKKLQVNVAINGICTITGKTIDQVMANKELSNLALFAAQEISDIALVLIREPLRSEEQLRSRLEASVGHYPSMERDFVFNKKLEIDAIYKAPVEIASICGTQVEAVGGIFKILDKMEKIRDNGASSDQAREAVKDEMDKLVGYASSRYRAPSPIQVAKNSPSSSRTSPATVQHQVAASSEDRLLPNAMPTPQSGEPVLNKGKITTNEV